LDSIIEGLKEAIKLLISFDKGIYEIIVLSLYVTVMSTGIAAILGLPCGVLLGSTKFAGRKLLMRIISTFMGLPPVVAGLLVYMFISRKGPLGFFQLLYTPKAMIIAQILIVFPIITGLTAAAVKAKSKPILTCCKGLNLTTTQKLFLLIYECRYPIISAIVAGYGRAIAEVGAVSMVGGNISGKTRVMTTYIALESSKGNYGMAIAIGIVLLTISFLINWGVQGIQERDGL